MKGSPVGHLLRALDAALPLAAAWAVYRAPDDVHTRLVREDGILEWLQVAALAIVVVVLLVRVVRTRSVAPAAGAGIAFFVAGEEMAWGSRLFEAGVPLVQTANRQGDVTLHNLHGGLTASFLAVAVAGIIGGLWILRRQPSLAVWFAAPAVYAAARVAYTGVITPRAAKVSEVLELVLYLAVARAVTWPPPRPEGEGAVAFLPSSFTLRRNTAGRSL